MKEKKRSIAPSRTAVVVTAVALAFCGGGCIFLYGMSLYLPLLLTGILLLLPAVTNLLLLLPNGRRERKASKDSKIVGEAKLTNGVETTADDVSKTPKRKHIRRAFRACYGALVRFWEKTHRNLLPLLIVLATVGANVYFWLMVRRDTIFYAVSYYIPVVLVVMFVLFIVLDKWCKHAGDSRGPAVSEGENSEERMPPDAGRTYDRALLHSLRGGLAVGRWALLVLAVALMVQLLGLIDLVKVAVVVVCLLFVYETLFLLVSLSVRVIRQEMQTAPELSIPMPGLGGEDLGIISYLEKNTGITMRSLWSIRLIKQVLPYTAMAVVLLLWGFSGMVKIEAEQQGAHYRLGVLQEETLQPGLHMTLPWPFDRVEVYDTEVVSNMTIGYVSTQSTDNIWTEAHGGEEYKLLLGGGNELVSINLRLVYHIDDLKAYLSHHASPETLMQATAYEIVTHRTIRTDLNTLLATDRTVFANDLRAELIERLATYNTGISVDDVVLESIHPPVDIADIYQQMVSAEAEAVQIVQTANGMAELIRINADRKQYEIVGNAKAKKDSMVKDAEVEAAKFEAYVAAKESWTDNGGQHTYEYFQYLQAIAAAYGTGDCQVIIIGDGVNTSNIYIGNVSLGGK